MKCEDGMKSVGEMAIRMLLAVDKTVDKKCVDVMRHVIVKV